MTPVQSVRSDLLKLRNIRRLQRAPMIAKYLGVGLNADVLNDDRTERLAALLAAASPSSVLEHVTDWVPPVLAYVNGLSELTIGEMWDWEASMPMCRVSASSIAERPRPWRRSFPADFSWWERVTATPWRSIWISTNTPNISWPELRV
jgi:hypothetical protein